MNAYRSKILLGTETIPLRAIYMIGDNPASDIAGANGANKNSSITWRSVLVESGVYKPGTVPEHAPTTIKANVWEAIDWILSEEGKNQKNV